MNAPRPGRAATICLFAKPPRPGEAKTRLAAALGNAAAARLAEAFLADTIERSVDLAGTRLILATTEPEAPEWAKFPPLERWDQGPGDLGEKLERVFRRALGQAPIAVAIGGDSPELPRSTLERAVSRLAADEGKRIAALAAAADGGFTLLALRDCPVGLLHGIPWSTRETCAAVRSRLRERGFEILELPSSCDIDELEDLKQLRDRLETDEPQRRALPNTAQALRANDVALPLSRSPSGSLLSVIVPVLDEELRLGPMLDDLERLDGIDEAIVVDGGSRDGTFELAAARPGVRAIRAPRGRAAQMNAGAAAAKGDILLFLHADAKLPADAGRQVHETLAEAGVVAGAFRLRTVAEGRSGWIRHFLPVADVRSRYSRLPYGDQAIFTRADDFRAVGGFPDQELMEDLELSRRLSRRGRIRIARGIVEVSGRRFFARPVYYPLAINLFPLLYALGVSPATLARWYGNPR